MTSRSEPERRSSADFLSFLTLCLTERGTDRYFGFFTLGGAGLRNKSEKKESQSLGVGQLPESS
jgi:hypothetical protein